MHSVVGRLLGLKAPIYSGRSAVRGLAVFPHGHGLKHEVLQFVDGSSRAGCAPLTDTELYWFAVYKSPPPEKGIISFKIPHDYVKLITKS